MSINKVRPWHIQVFTDGQIDITNDLVVLNVQQFIPDSLMWKGFTKNEIDKYKIEYAHWILKIINHEVLSEDAIKLDCVWDVHDEEANAWEAECGLIWCFEVGGAKENEMNFCPKCGRPLTQRALDAAPIESDDE